MYHSSQTAAISPVWREGIQLGKSAGKLHLDFNGEILELDRQRWKDCASDLKCGVDGGRIEFRSDASLKVGMENQFHAAREVNEMPTL